MSNKKIGCLFINIDCNKEDYGSDNFKTNDFFAYNAINSFKKWNPNVDIHYITDDNFKSYLKDLKITEYYNAIGLIRIYIIKELLRQKGYDKIIMLGLDTFTCSYLDDFINNNEDDLICSSGPPYSFMKTDYWSPKVVDGDVDFINSDVACFNNWEAADMLINKSIEFWTGHSEQGGMNYMYQNQKFLNIKVSIVDFPYKKANSLYNVRSKGIAHGGNQMHGGKLYNGNYKDPNSSVIGNIYPTSTYNVKDNKLFTLDGKQIKVFHYAEALGGKTKEEYNVILNEIKTMWFNKETKKFLIEQCNCNF